MPMKRYFLLASLLFFQTTSTAPEPLEVIALHSELQKLSQIELEAIIEQIQNIFHNQAFEEERSAHLNLKLKVYMGPWHSL